MFAQHGRSRVFSGVQPTGKLHLGNFVGALDVWASSQDQHHNVFCIVDLHALTIPEAVRPDDLRSKVREVAGLYIACGIDPATSAIFVQSRIAAHAELAWVLNCVTPLGWLERMTQYKAKSAGTESVGTGLLGYPVLQAADILLYDTNLVPVGEDQRQHVELTRDVARRFNHLFGETLVIPDALIRESGARLMGLDDPTVKMSKSIGAQKAGHAIGLLDPPDVIRRAIMGAVTDANSETRFDHASPGVLNLLVICEALTGEARPAIESRFEGKGYGYLKRTLTDILIERLAPIQRRYAEVASSPGEIERIMEDGADRVRPRAEATMDRVRRVTGLAQRPST